MPAPVVVIPVAAGPEDGARATDLLASLAACEPAATAVLIVDDEPGGPRSWPVEAIANPRAGRGIPTLGGTTAATLAGLAWAHAHHAGSWVLRLDSDALVIGPFAAAVDTALRPEDGILGSCHRTCNGDVRDVSVIGGEVRRHGRALWAWRKPPRRPWWIRPADRRVRAVLRAARHSGYRPGEHCIAAGCVVTAPLIGALDARRWLTDPARWTHARLGDDMVLGAMSRACGLELRDLPAVFGLRHRGLPDTPQGLADRHFAIIHSVRNDPAVPEEDVRAFFARARADAVRPPEPSA